MTTRSVRIIRRADDLCTNAESRMMETAAAYLIRETLGAWNISRTPTELISPLTEERSGKRHLFGRDPRNFDWDRRER